MELRTRPETRAVRTAIKAKLMLASSATARDTGCACVTLPVPG